MEKTFADVLTIKNGRNQKNVENPNGRYPIYGSGGIMGRADEYICDCNTVIIGRKGSINNPIYVTEPFWNVDTAFGLVANKELLLPKYLYYFCRHFDFEKLNTTVTIPSLTKANLLKIKIGVPPIERQQYIVALLDEISDTICDIRTVLSECDTLIKSRFVELFGNTLTNPKVWKECYLNEYIEFITSGSRGWAKYFTNDKAELFITIKNVKNNHISLDDIQYINAPSNKEAERTKVQAGDLLISITADLGRTGVVDEEIANMGAYINQHLSLVRLRTNDINPLYVSYYLETEGGKAQFDRKNQNGVKAGLNFEAIKSLKILVPPKELQEEYILFVKEIDKLKVACL